MDDIRWIQRLDNYNKALIQLNNEVNLSKTRHLTELEEQGKSRNMSSHTYDREIAKSIVHLVINKYILEFNALLTKMSELKEDDE